MPRTMAVELTPRQAQALEHIARFQARPYCSATIRELAEALGVSRATAFEHVAALREKGLVAPANRRARSLRCSPRGLRLLETAAAHRPPDAQSARPSPAGPVTDEHARPQTPPDEPATTSSIPLLGRVAAGLPIDAIEEHQELPLAALFGRDDVFALEVAGDSMIKAGIRDGDYLVCRKTATAEPGQLVVAIVDDETATVKRFYPEASRIRLEPANPAYEPIYTDHCRIEAVVVGLLRRL